MLLLLLAACGTPNGVTSQNGAGGASASGTCGKAGASFDVNLLNLPAGVSPTMLSIEVIDDKGKKITINGKSAGNASTAWFSATVPVGRKYKAQLVVSGQKYGSLMPVPFIASQCSFHTTYDADTGEQVTGA